jgi:hypothetical protein
MQAAVRLDAVALPRLVRDSSGVAFDRLQAPVAMTRYLPSQEVR